MNGTKIISIKYRNVKIIDSYSFIPIALDKFCETFEIKNTAKSFFPHLFNQPGDNQNYIGKIPDIKYFNHEYFSDQKRIEFLNWYDKFSNSNAKYIFKNEFHKYCLNDVYLLTQGCLAFRRIIMDTRINHVVRVISIIRVYLC